MTDATIASPPPASPLAAAHGDLASQIRARGLGSASSWVRDLGLMGLISGVLGPLLGGQGVLPMAYVAACGITGAVLGLGIGWLLRWLLTDVLTDLSSTALLFLVGPVVGFFWGAAVGAVGGLTLTSELMSLSIIFATASAMAQLSWFWLPYALFRAQGRVAWPLLALSGLTPFVGAAFLHVGGI